MAKIKRLSEVDGNGWNGELAFYCPACKCCHEINDDETKNDSPIVWRFNKNFDFPTIRASVLVESKFKEKDTRCHSFVTDGNIQYLSDCTHELAGKTVELLEWDDSKLYD